MKGICLKCGFMSDYEFRNINGSETTPRCKRCYESRVEHTSKIKRYFACSRCGYTIKLPDVTAIQILVHRDSLKCDRNGCTGSFKQTTKEAYLKFSGQLKKHIETENRTLL